MLPNTHNRGRALGGFLLSICALALCPDKRRDAETAEERREESPIPLRLWLAGISAFLCGLSVSAFVRAKCEGADGEEETPQSPPSVVCVRQHQFQLLSLSAFQRLPLEREPESRLQHLRRGTGCPVDLDAIS